jgi:hypothetical protein
MKIWTKRGSVLTQKDKDVIGSIARKSEEAAQIFMTGEIYGKRLTSEEEGLLMAANEMTRGPLFVRTKVGTVRMRRFDPAVVWKLIDPDVVERLFEREGARFGLTGLRLDEWDFCYSVIQYIKIQFGDFHIPLAADRSLEAFYQAMYLSALILFEKPGYMAVPVSQHFALPETEEAFKTMHHRALKVEEVDRLLELQKQFGEVDGLTNGELRFLLDLYDTDQAVK